MMPKPSLSADEMIAIFREHATAEFDQDLDKTMAFVSENPVFEWPALNLRIGGRDAVREMYRRLLTRAISAHVLYQRVLAAGESVLTAEYVLSVDHTDRPPTRIGLAAIIEFEGDKISAERTYTHPDYIPLLRDALGEGFDRYPGVTQIDYGPIVEACGKAVWP